MGLSEARTWWMILQSLVWMVEESVSIEVGWYLVN